MLAKRIISSIVGTTTIFVLVGEKRSLSGLKKTSVFACQSLSVGNIPLNKALPNPLRVGPDISVHACKVGRAAVMGSLNG